jgi:hypothetical protein
MKINKLEEIDLSQYKLAYYEGDSLSHYSLCQEDVMALIEGGKDPGRDMRNLFIALIPKNNKLTECEGDGWDEVPAKSNASGFCEYPKGTIFLKGKLGQELRVVEKS